MEDFSLKVQVLVQIHIVWAAGHWIQEGGGCIKGDVHIEIAILDFLDLDGVVGDVDGVDPGVLKHLTAHMDVEVLLPLDDAIRNRCFEEVGVVDGLVVSLAEGSRAGQCPCCSGLERERKGSEGLSRNHTEVAPVCLVAAYT